MNRAPGNSGNSTSITQLGLLLPAAVVFFLVFACGAGETASAPQSGRRHSGVISHVTDGDTLVLKVGELSHTIRLDGIDAPEGGQPFSDQSRQHLRVLCFSQRATAVVRETDRYGRLVARVLVQGRDLSEEMIAAGMAWHFLRYSSDGRLAALEKKAREQRAGLWADRSPMAPWTWRDLKARGRASASPGAPRPDAVAVAVPGPYHGNVSSGVYHAPACRDYNCRNCTRAFATRQEAESAGFKPHGACVFPGKYPAK